MTGVSVVIPTFNRARTLDRCLAHLAVQSVGPREFEVVVADDDSTDGTAEVVRRWLEVGTLRLVYRQCAKGFAGAARNRGVEVASGDRVLFLGDDVLADRDLVARHLEADRRHGPGVAIVGSVRLDRTGYTPFMEYLEETGTHHAFPQLQEQVGRPLPGWYFYACNASVPRAVHEAVGGFDENIRRAYEDGEYGVRVVRAGCPLYFAPAAAGVHVHPTTVSGYVRFLRGGREDIATVTRMALAQGEAAPPVGRHPVLDRLPLDGAVQGGARLLAAFDRWLPAGARRRLYASLLGYERRQAHRRAGITPG